MTIRFVPRDRCNALSNTTNKTNDTKTSLIVVKPTTTKTLNRRERETNILNSLSRERIQNLIKRTSKTVNRSFSLAFFRHKFNTFIPNASASDASFAFDMFAPFLANDNEEEEEALLFYGDDESRVLSLAQKRMFKISNSLSDLR